MKAGGWTRREAIRLRREYIKRNLRRFAGYSVAYAGALGIAAWGASENKFGLGLLVGAGGATWIAALAWVIAMESRSQRYFEGADAERWSAQEFRKLRREWTCLNDIPLTRGNVDHVLIGRRGIVAVETKFTRDPNHLWRSGFWGFDKDPIKQARDGAAAIERILAEAGVRVEVRPALAIWGSGAREYEDRAPRAVTILSSRQRHEWKDRLSRTDANLDPETIEVAKHAIDDWQRANSAPPIDGAD